MNTTILRILLAVLRSLNDKGFVNLNAGKFIGEKPSVEFWAPWNETSQFMKELAEAVENGDS